MDVKAQELLTYAADLIGGDRQIQHGDKHALHARIARFWNVYLGTCGGRFVQAKDVAVMMALLKIARTTTGAPHPDNFVDCAGYIAIAGELALKELSNVDTPKD